MDNVTTTILKNKENIKAIFGTFEVRAQLCKLIEELIELQGAALDVNSISGSDVNDFKNILIMQSFIDEMADVLVIISQFIYCLELDDKVAETIQFKVKRTLDRIKEM